MYTLGHFALSLDDSRVGLAIGLSLIAIGAGLMPHISWQIHAYSVLTSAEVMISITCLEFSYTQAPVKMKSFIMAFFMMSIAISNLFTSAVNFFIENDDGTSKLAGADYFWFFTLLMLITAVAFIFITKTYKETTYRQKGVVAEKSI